MKNSPHSRTMDDATRWEKFAALEQDVSGLKQDIAGLDGRISHMGEKLDVSLARIFDKVEAGTRRHTPWNIIFSFAGIAATIILALSAWANAYFGQAIASAQREASQAMGAHGAMQSQINALREDHTAALVQAARNEERQASDRAEIDRLRAVGKNGG